MKKCVFFNIYSYNINMIKKARKEDIERIIEISSFARRKRWKQYFAKDKARYLSYGFLQLYDKFKIEQLAHYYVYIEDGIIKGILRYAIEDKKVFIEELAADPLFADEDILKKMYRLFEAVAIKHDMEMIYLWALIKDQMMIELILELGFIPENNKRYLDDTMLLEQQYYKKIS